MARKESRVKRVMITQQLRSDLFPDWSDAERATLNQGAQAYGKVLLDKLDDAELSVSTMYAITHDKDTYREWNEVKDDYEIVVKPEHMHVVVAFLDGVESTISRISKATGVPENLLEKSKRGRHAGNNMLAYLIHAKDEGKHQYDPSEVASIEGEDYMNIYARSRESWEKGRAVKKKTNAKNPEDVEYYLSKVLLGKLNKKEMFDDEELYALYAYNKSKFDEAFDTYAQRRAYVAARKLENGEFSTTILFVTGKPGGGKSAWVKDEVIPKIIDAARERGERWEMYKSAATNPLDDWMGEEIILLDDLRADAMSASDWLLLLDPHQAGTASARYHNKQSVAPRVIVLTAYQSPLEFFNYVPRSGGNEALDQFIRRLSAIIRVHEYDWLEHNGRFTLEEVGKSEPYEYVHRNNHGDVESPMNHAPVVRWADRNSKDAVAVSIGLLLARSHDMREEGGEIKVPIPSAVLAKYAGKKTALMRIMNEQWNNLALMRHMSDTDLSEFMNDLGVDEQVMASDILNEQQQYEEDKKYDSTVLNRGRQNLVAVPMTPEQEKKYNEEMEKINRKGKETLERVNEMLQNEISNED